MPDALLAAPAERHLVTSGHPGPVVVRLAGLQIVRQRQQQVIGQAGQQSHPLSGACNGRFFETDGFSQTINSELV